MPAGIVSAIAGTPDPLFTSFIGRSPYFTALLDEMDATGAQEILLPIAQPLELWAKTGRDATYGPLMFRLEDRKETGYATSEAQYRHWDRNLPQGLRPGKSGA